MYRTFTLAALLALATTAVQAAPSLRSNIVVVGEIVTVGDMFEDAGELAGKPLFRAPAPGTAGSVSLEAVRQAASLAGLTDYVSDGILQVRVARASTIVDETMLSTLITSDLVARGIAGNGIEVRAAFNAADTLFYAEQVADPARLLDLRYTPVNGLFAARFAIAGRSAPVEISGRIELMVEAPHLVGPRPAGTILSPTDIEMRQIPLKQSETVGAASPDQLIGKQLMRQSRGGMLLRPADVVEPRVVERNAMVMVVLSQGPMTLTVKGQALNSAAAGERVQVLNPASRKILHGVALPSGAVEITNTINVAGL